MIHVPFLREKGSPMLERNPIPPSMADSAFTWLDGKLIDSSDANFPILTHALHYGFGVFEGIRC